MPPTNPAEPAATEPGPGQATAAEASGGGAGALIARVVLGLAGLGLLVGFFLPWIHLGAALSMSGLSMALTGGEAIQDLSGFRLILLVVPLSGLALLVSAVRGRAFAWVGLISGVLIFATALFTLIRVFLDSTGAGMWVVAGSALVAASVGFAAYRRL